MKTPFAIFTFFILLLAIAGCGSKQYAAYQCPMKCEDAKTYPKEGTCPVCGMDLEGIDSTQAAKPQ